MSNSSADEYGILDCCQRGRDSCNHRDADRCCGGGYNASCDCQECHPAEPHPDPNAKVRLRVRVLPVTYTLELGRYEWDGLTEDERSALVYDATEENCKFEIKYEVLP